MQEHVNLTILPSMNSPAKLCVAMRGALDPGELSPPFVTLPTCGAAANLKASNHPAWQCSEHHFGGGSLAAVMRW
jgi:hypothetical protein